MTFNLTILFAGVVTSPNFPSSYPNNLELTQTVQVDPALILSLEFTAFSVDNIGDGRHCEIDYLVITEGDGTILMGKSCGEAGNLYIDSQKIDSPVPPTVKSKTNTVNILFLTTPYDTTHTGWSVNWRALTPGKCAYFPSSKYVILLSFP